MLGFGKVEIRTLDTGKTDSRTIGKTEKIAVNCTEVLVVVGTMSGVMKVIAIFANVSAQIILKA